MALGVFLSWEAQRQVDSAFERWRRAEQVWSTVEYLIARDPTVGEPLNETGTVRTITWEGAFSVGLPTVTVLYTFDETDVTIRSTEWVDAKAATSGHA